MMMIKKTFYDMLDELEDISSHTDIDKHLVYILRRVKNAEAFFRLTFNDTVYGLAEKSFYNAFINFGLEWEITKGYNHVSDYLYDTPQLVGHIDIKIPLLLDFAKEITLLSGDAQLLAIQKFFNILNNQKKKWFCRALLHDLRCGVQVKTINKAFKAVGLKQIKKFSMQLCAKGIDLYEKDNKQLKKITYPCSMELKEDGIRLQADIATYNGMTGCLLTSRRGKDRTDKHPELVKDLARIFEGENIILDGEITASSFNSLTRKDDKSKRTYVVYDLLNDENLPYMNRWDNLTNLFCDKGITEYKDNKFNNIIEQSESSVAIVEHYTANSLEDLKEYYEDLNRRKEEGMIIKLDDRPYERGSRKNMFKVKKVFDADLICVGFNYGEGKRAGMVGSLQLQDASGLVKVDVGTGFSTADIEELTNQLGIQIIENDETVKPYFKPDFVGKIVEIQYNEVSMNKYGQISLRFPRFICIREDLDEPENLSKLGLRK